ILIIMEETHDTPSQVDQANLQVSSRSIPYIKYNRSNYSSPLISADYVSKKGILFNADVLDLLTNIKKETIDLAFADPPFNLGKNYEVAELNDSMAAEAYRGWCRTWLLEIARVLKPGGALFLYHWPLWLMDLGAWLNSLPLLEYKSWIALKMKNGFPIKGRIQPAHYGLLYYVKVGGKPTFNVVRSKSPTCRHCGELIRDYGGYRKKFEQYEDEDGVPWIALSDFWEDTRPERHYKARENKINELPMHVPERAILMASNPGDVVLDCFAGGGSTLHAAHYHDRLWIGGEIGDTSMILRRINTFFGSEETKPSTHLLKCFHKRFRTAISKLDLNQERPIEKAGRMESIPKSMDKYASKSKIMP
ncbi:MAG TPA: site-specific DNA-methyltransferase, partial [Pyrinomonadaceae bacterium]|nr:site-specific DNA-methyltransferase [Pyrinomonadaceae bacterium]